MQVLSAGKNATSADWGRDRAGQQRGQPGGLAQGKAGVGPRGAGWETLSSSGLWWGPSCRPPPKNGLWASCTTQCPLLPALLAVTPSSQRPLLAWEPWEVPPELPGTLEGQPRCQVGWRVSSPAPAHRLKPLPQWVGLVGRGRPSLAAPTLGRGAPAGAGPVSVAARTERGLLERAGLRRRISGAQTSLPLAPPPTPILSNPCPPSPWDHHSGLRLMGGGGRTLGLGQP